jgi:hypothetical protein
MLHSCQFWNLLRELSISMSPWSLCRMSGGAWKESHCIVMRWVLRISQQVSSHPGLHQVCSVLKSQLKTGRVSPDESWKPLSVANRWAVVIDFSRRWPHSIRRCSRSRVMERDGIPIPRYARGACIRADATVLWNPICCFVGLIYFLWMLISSLCGMRETPRGDDIAVWMYILYL